MQSNILSNLISRQIPYSLVCKSGLRHNFHNCKRSPADIVTGHLKVSDFSHLRMKKYEMRCMKYDIRKFSYSFSFNEWVD